MTTQTKQNTSPYGQKDHTRDEEMFKREVEPRMRELMSLNEDTTEGFDEE